MSDRELLKAAAEAAGLTTLVWFDSGSPYFPPSPHVSTAVHGMPTFWNPLAEDGDALRLAVKLQVQIDPYHAPTGIVNVYHHSGIEFAEDVDINGGDIYAATRRAIVRAAAAIGESAKATGAA